MKSCLRGMAACCLLSAVMACEKAPDLSAVIAERGKPVLRTDGFLAAASNERTLVSAGGSVLVRSSDSGQTWVRHQLPSPAAIVALASCPDGSFAALDFYRRVWIGDAEARDWQPKAITAEFNPVALACDPANRLWVVGSFSTVLSSTDHGDSWQAQPPGEDAILTTVSWLDAEHGRIAGEFGTQRLTADGGKTWTVQKGLPEDFYPYTMLFADARHGWATGIGGAVLHSDDGGASWTAEQNAVAAPLYALLRVEGEMYAIGGGGAVLKRNDGVWTPIADAPHFATALNAGAQLAPHKLLVVGAAGTLGVVSLNPSAVQARGSVPAVTGGQP